MLTAIVDNIKTIGTCVSAVGAVCGGYLYLDGPVPASRSYVLAETQSLKGRVIDNQLQLNIVQRNLLRKEKLDRDIELQKNPDPAVRSILNQRLEQITDELDAIERERDELRKEKTAK